LESKIAMSTGAATGGGAAFHVITEHDPIPILLRSPTVQRPVDFARTKTIRLSGEATGTYTRTAANPDTGALYRIKARGAITPIARSASVTGSFQTLGFINGGVETGTLTISGPKGKLYVKLSEIILSVAAGDSIQPGSSINPGGPAIPASKTTIVTMPIVIVYTFDYRIVGGTGQYAHDKGTGVVHISTTPRLTVPKGPGIYATNSAALTSSGRVSVDFLPNCGLT
jgi:hypothetical protein